MLTMSRETAEELDRLLRWAKNWRIISPQLVEKGYHLQLELETIAKDAEHRVFPEG
jgi:hypothetical protein